MEHNTKIKTGGGLKTTNFKIMTNDNKQHKPLDSTERYSAKLRCRIKCR